MLVKASAPGSMMLLGEYGVLQGKQALVCAVDQRITVTLVPRADRVIKICSHLGSYTGNLSALEMKAPFEFMLTAIQQCSTNMITGCELTVTTEFSHKVGLGSSAAVTVATLAALQSWLALFVSETELLASARRVIQSVQGLGSGADVAASVYGGLVVYQMQPLQPEKISYLCPITAVYAGYKTPTIKAVRHVEAAFADQPDTFARLCSAIDRCAQQGIQAARAQDWQALGATMNAQQTLMHDLGVCTPDLQHIIDKLREHKDILGAKISGSGLGDCIIALGASVDIPWQNPAVKTLPITMSLQGVTCEKI